LSLRMLGTEDKPADGDLLPDYVDDLPPGDEHNSIQARMKAAATIRGIGNDLFRAGKYAQAAAKYEKVEHPWRTWFMGLVQCLRYLEDKFPGDDVKKELQAAQLSAQINLAACLLKLNEYIFTSPLTSFSSFRSRWALRR
jgi:hypothetical protein